MRTFTTALSLLALAALDQTNAIELTSAASAAGKDECKVLSGVPAPMDFSVKRWRTDYENTAEGDPIKMFEVFESNNEGQNLIIDKPLSHTVGYLECNTRNGDNDRHMLVTIDHEFEDGNIQSASYEFTRFSDKKIEVPLDSELLKDGGITGAATKTFTMDSMDATVSYAIAYAEAGCTGIQQVIQGEQNDEFQGFNKAAEAAVVIPTVSMGGNGASSDTRGGSSNSRGSRLAQVESSVEWSNTYAKSFMLKVKANGAGVVPEGYSLMTAVYSDTYQYETSVELVTEYNVCVENTDATQIYAKIMLP